MECGLIFRGLSLSVNFEFEFDTMFFIVGMLILILMMFLS